MLNAGDKKDSNAFPALKELSLERGLGYKLTPSEGLLFLRKSYLSAEERKQDLSGGRRRGGKAESGMGPVAEAWQTRPGGLFEEKH